MADYEYDVALSYAGEDRVYVEQVAIALTERKITVFYDRYEQSSLWGQDLYSHLHEVYSKKARFCIMFVSAHYARKQWTSHERQSAQSRAFAENREYILPVRFDSTAIPGLSDTVGYIDAGGTKPSELADLVQRKVAAITAGDGLPPVNLPVTIQAGAPARSGGEYRRFSPEIGAGFSVAVVLLFVWTFFWRFDQIRFDVWHDWSRKPAERNQVMMSKKMIAVVLYGSKAFDVGDIDMTTVRASDGNGSGTPVKWYHPETPNLSYDENKDGFPDRKLDFDVEFMWKVADISAASKQLRVWGLMPKANRRFDAQQSITVLP